MKNTFLTKLKKFLFSGKLKESEIRYRRLFESAKDGILILDFETGKITDANPYIVEIIDHPFNEIIGEKLWEIGLFSNIEESKLAFKELKKKGYIRFEDMPIQRQNGKVTEVEFVSNVYIENNRKVIQCNIRNITLRKQIERKQKLTAKILAILNNPDSWELSIKSILEDLKYYTGIETINIQLKTKESLPFEQTLKSNESFIHEEQYMCQLNDKDEVVYEQIKTPYQQNLCDLVISGKTDPLLNHFTEGGSFFSNNFSEDIKSSVTKEQSSDIQKDFIENSYESVAIIPLFSGSEIIGVLQMEDRRSGIFDLETIQFFEKTGNSIGIAFIRILNEDKIKEDEKNLSKQNIEYHKLNQEYMDLNMVLKENLKKLHDINNELILAKMKAEESDKLKAAFLANISHEIRTPLNSIMGFSGFLTNPALSKEKFEHFIQMINSSSLQLLAIISDLIDISKIEAGQMIVRTEKVDINEIMDELNETYEPLARIKNTQIENISNPKNEKIYLYTDGCRIKQVLCNLLNNAVKFTTEGQIQFGFNVKHSFIEFYVSDTGIGIAEANQELIFEHFRQVETKLSNMLGGNGLGLSISKALIEKMGGTIKVNSELGIGSTFIFTIPYVKKSGNEENTPLFPNENQLNNWSKKTILIVEDEKDSHTYIEEMLSGSNVQMLHAWGGQKAVDLVKTHPNISLVLMDIKMPIMNGYEALQHIKQIRPELPIIAQTAYAESKDREEALMAGFDNYISKPIVQKEFLAMVSHYLN